MRSSGHRSGYHRRDRTHWRYLTIVLALLVSVGIGRPGAIGKAHAATPAYPDSQVIVTLAPGTSVTSFNTTHDTRTLDALPDGRTFVLDLPVTQTTDMAQAAWASESELATIEPNYTYDLSTGDRLLLTADQGYITFHGSASPTTMQDQWALSTMEVPAAQQISAGNGITVAVLDTGVDLQHPALTGHIALGGYDYISQTTTISDVAGGPVSGHGTFVAGLVAQVAPGATILPFRVLDSNGQGTVGNVADAIETATNDGARIINLSMGTGVPSVTLHNAVSYAQARGVVVVTSAGNQGTATEQYPAAWDGVVAVAGTDQHDQRASFSNYGSWISVSAPAVDLYSSYPGGGFAIGSGTSFAAPLVAGEIALFCAAHPAQIPDDVPDVIAQSSVDIDPLNAVYAGLLGAGRVDALYALTANL